MKERGLGRGAVVHRRAAPWPFPDSERGFMHATGDWCSASCRISLDSLVELVPDSQGCQQRAGLLFSPDQRPPTSPRQDHQSGVRARCPTSSGYVRSLLRRATTVTAPLTCATPVLNHRSAKLTPAWCRLLTARPQTAARHDEKSQVASHSGWEQPSPCRGPSCSSPLLPLPPPLLGRSWRQHSRQRSLSSSTPCPGTRCAVAMSVEWTATPASAFGLREMAHVFFSRRNDESLGGKRAQVRRADCKGPDSRQVRQVAANGNSAHPTAARRSSRDRANARAVAQDRRAPSLARTASQDARQTLHFGFANWLTKDRASSDHRPPTSAANTTSLARSWDEEISGYVRCSKR